MAKVWNDIKFTAAEKRTIERAWLLLEAVASDCGREGARLLKEAFELETRGGQSVPTLAAKALLCQWFERGTTVPPLRDLFGLRAAAINMYILAARAGHTCKVTSEDCVAWRSAAVAKDVAFTRMSAAKAD